MAITAVDQAGDQQTLATPTSGGLLEETATTVFRATDTFFKDFGNKVDALTGKWLGLDDRKDIERTPLDQLHRHKFSKKTQPPPSEKLNRDRPIESIMVEIAMLLFLLNAGERDLRRREKAGSLDNQMKYMEKGREEAVETAKGSTQYGGVAAVIQFLPMAVGPVLKYIAPWTAANGWLHGRMGIVPDLSKTPALEDTTKLLRQVSTAPATFVQQWGQNRHTVFQADNGFYQGQAQKAQQTGQGAEAFIRETRDDDRRLFETTTRLLDTLSQSRQRISQQS